MQPPVRILKPQRIQLSRRKGFNLQAVSLALNGLPAVNVSRPSRYGNPHRVGWCAVCGAEHTQQEAVDEFRAELDNNPTLDLSPLRGKNLACWCKISEPCHCDPLIEKANK